MEKARTKDCKNMNVITFSNIPRNVVEEMAKHLDSDGEANWEALADWHGLSQVDIQVMNV